MKFQVTPHAECMWGDLKLHEMFTKDLQAVSTSGAWQASYTTCASDKQYQKMTNFVSKCNAVGMLLFSNGNNNMFCADNTTSVLLVSNTKNALQMSHGNIVCWQCWFPKLNKFGKKRWEQYHIWRLWYQNQASRAWISNYTPQNSMYLVQDKLFPHYVLMIF